MRASNRLDPRATSCITCAARTSPGSRCALQGARRSHPRACCTPAPVPRTPSFRSTCLVKSHRIGYRRACLGRPGAPLRLVLDLEFGRRHAGLRRRHWIWQQAGARPGDLGVGRLGEHPHPSQRHACRSALLPHPGAGSGAGRARIATPKLSRVCSRACARPPSCRVSAD